MQRNTVNTNRGIGTNLTSIRPAESRGKEMLRVQRVNPARSDRSVWLEFGSRQQIPSGSAVRASGKRRLRAPPTHSPRPPLLQRNTSNTVQFQHRSSRSFLVTLRGIHRLRCRRVFDPCGHENKGLDSGFDASSSSIAFMANTRSFDWNGLRMKANSLL